MRAVHLVMPALVVASTVAIPALATTSSADTTRANAAADRDYPLVLDLDLDPVCKRPVNGRVSVYHPRGVESGARVEWRLRIGDATVRTGTVSMTATVASAEFTLAPDEVPGRGEAQVDARVLGGGEPGPYGKVWRERIGQSCDPVRVVSVGDSVVWNQGVDQDQKFPYLTAKMLGDETGRGFQHADYSVSGAVLDAPELPAGNNDAACLTQRYRQDPDGDGEMEFGEVTDQMPDVFCQLERARADAVAAGRRVDLVVLNGCINDLDPFFGIPLGITPGSEDLAKGVLRECSGVGAAAENPARDVPYFSGAKVGYGGRGMRAAIEKAHSLPGRPKVLVANFLYAFSRASLPVIREFCTGRDLPAELEPHCREGLGQAADRYEQYTRYSGEAYRLAANAANAASKDGPYAVAGDGLFTLDQAVLAPDQKVWADPTQDQKYSLRRYACPELSATPAQCLSAGVAHPDVAGSRQYAEAFLLNPRVRGWFKLPGSGKGPTLKASTLSGTPGVEVAFQAAPARDGATYHWYFGDGEKLVTQQPTVAHTYRGVGPHLPRLVMVDRDGRRTLHEAPAPVVVTAP